MSTPSQVKLLLKILIGAAWLDGTIQPEEKEYLQQVAAAQGMAEDREIKALIHGLVPVKPDQCDRWVKEYLGDNPSKDSHQELLTAVSGLIYSDGEVATNEAKLLMSLQPPDSPSSSQPKSIVHRLRQLYQQMTRDL
jgi:uncharacterized tellurite resistance protein B-like protein